MRRINLIARRPDPFRHAIVIFAIGADVPPDDQKHHIQDSDFDRRFGEIGECAEDVGEEAGEGVRVDAALWPEGAAKSRIGGADEVGFGVACGGVLASFAEEFEEEAVEGTGCWDVDWAR